jgi:hypothetical protein
MSNEDRIARLQEYRGKLLQWRRNQNADLRSFINQNTVSVRREVLEAGCYHTVTVCPPLCRRLLGWPASESGTLCQGDGGYE